MDTFEQAKVRGAFIFGFTGVELPQDRRTSLPKEWCEFRQYSQHCKSNGLAQVKVERPKCGLVAVEIDRIFCPKVNCNGMNVPEELEKEYHQLIGFFSSRIMNLRYVKPAWSVAENPISTLTYFKLPEYKLWQVLPDIIRFAEKTLAFQRHLMKVQGRCAV